MLTDISTNSTMSGGKSIAGVPFPRDVMEEYLPATWEDALFSSNTQVRVRLCEFGAWQECTATCTCSVKAEGKVQRVVLAELQECWHSRDEGEVAVAERTVKDKD